MKKLLTTLIIILSCYTAFTQRVRYDNGPIILGNPNGFVTNGTWGRTNITFRFFNGTADIANSDEHNAVRQAFQIWSDYAPFTFTEVTGTPDISISWQVGDHGDGAANAFDGVNGVLAHAFFPNPGNAGGLPGDLHFDDAETWTMAERPNGAQPIDLVTVAAHEIGHALGLDHSNVACALMNPFYTGSHRYLAPDDIAGIRSLYGNRNPITTSFAGAGICTNATYLFRNVPTGATVNWTSSNTGIATVAIVSNQAVVSRAGSANGTIVLTGTITLPCGLTVTETRTLTIGAPVTISYGMSGGCSSGWQGWFANAGPTNLGSSWSWTVGTLTGGSQINIYSPSSPSTNIGVKGGGAVRLNYTDICGTARQDGITVWSSCPPFRIMVSPNPVKDNLNISFTESESRAGETPAIAPLQRIDSKGRTIISLYEVNTNMLVKQWKYDEVKSSNYNLNINSARKGVYVLQVDRDNQATVTKVIVE